MKTADIVFAMLGVVSFALAAGPAGAQQVTGQAGAPGAMTTIDGEQLPPPVPEFGVVIKEGALESTPCWAPRVVPPEDAPNVLLIIHGTRSIWRQARDSVWVPFLEFV